MSNRLQYETSPYLLQHRNNPVDWVPWDEKYLEQARTEDKLVLVSIGYSACHWCHVMEHEVFEDTACAEIMNRSFINIKVDREERPDIDHVYMNALQLMTGSGGWPLNCILLPDGRPVYGGTYFPKDRWMQVLQTLSDLWKNDRDKMYEYAEKLHEAMQTGDTTALPKPGADTDWNALLKTAVNKWKTSFDPDFGGPRKAPKFPLPNNYRFLLRYALSEKDDEVLEHVQHTLRMMAYGGIYDQAGGGFARYSVDQYWKVPHFEKMLYDNAQLISLYAEAFAVFGDTFLAETVHETIAFCVREMKAPGGGWISALDADSEGEEGKFYVWKLEELQHLLGDDFELAQDYYNVNAEGYWEHGNYILMRQTDDAVFARKHELSEEAWLQTRERIKAVLLRARSGRARPGDDDKILLSWNALMVSALCDAYRYTRKCGYLELAEETWHFLERELKKDGRWMRTYKNAQAKIAAFIEDYAFLADAAIRLAEVSFNPDYLDKAEAVCQEALRKFWDEGKGFFRFRANDQAPLAAETYEIQDNVIPAANSQMALNLFRLARLRGKPEWETQASHMLQRVAPLMEHYAPGYSNWAQLAQYLTRFGETVFVGKEAPLKALDYLADFRPSVFVAASEKASAHPLFEGRFVEGKLLRYDCVNRACDLPVELNM